MILGGKSVWFEVRCGGGLGVVLSQYVGSLLIKVCIWVVWELR